MSSDDRDGAARKRPRPITRPQVPAGPLKDLKDLIYELYLEAKAPSLKEMAASVAADNELAGAPERDTIHRIIGGAGVPPSQADVVAVVRALARLTMTWDAEDAAGRARDLWVRSRMERPVGVPLGEARDPFALEVHRPIAAGDATVDDLPPYVRRAHDERLGQVVSQVLGGASAMSVLVADSSAGKTRACWEALKLLPAAGGWRLWHPYDPTRIDAALQDLERVGPRTVVWLNETQEYLGEGGERVAAKLRSLLADSARAPVLVLGTLWREHHAELAAQRSSSQVAQLLDGAVVIEVPEAFTGDGLEAMRLAAKGDARLAEAVEHAEEGKITQYLAGGPELVKRLEAAASAAKAVIWAAMDARRLGHREALPLALLKAAAPAYLSDSEWNVAGEDWLEQALAYTARPCKGALGPVTRIRPRSPERASRHTAAAAEPDDGPVYRLADYLNQHGLTTRADQIPPLGFWAAAAAHAHPGDLDRLATAAWNRGLYRDTTQLHKNAAAHGDSWAAQWLVGYLHHLYPTDHRPAAFAAKHAALDDPNGVAYLLAELSRIGATDQVTVLLGREPAPHAALDDPRAIADLMDRLRELGATHEMTALADWAAAHAAPDYSAVELLDGLRELGATHQLTALADRIAAHAALDDPGTIASLLRGLWKVGATHQVTALAERAAAHAALDDPGGVTDLLITLREVEATHQVAILLARDPAAHVTLHDPQSVDWLLRALREIGADDQITVLLARDPATQVTLNHAHTVTQLLDVFRNIGAEDQVAALLARDPASHVPLDDHPSIVSGLLDVFRNIGAEDQVAALLARDPAAHVFLHVEPRDVVGLLDAFRNAGAEDQVAILLARDPAAHVRLGTPFRRLRTPFRRLDTASVARLMDWLGEAKSS
ncbi:hypothetical protein [Nocardia salmonicida]|uniref:hypothetical protein n=1 Tax=Nocardia salmonicida TaxID=53431 RepID=UPI003CEA9BEF